MVENAPPPSVNKVLKATQGTLGRFVLLLVFLCSLAIGAVAHLSLPVSRRAAARILTDVVSKSIRGTILVGSFARLDRNGISLEDVVILDPQKRPTLKVETLTAEVDIVTILERVFSDNEKLSLEVQEIEALGCEVLLHTTKDKDEDGKPLSHVSIADAFEPIAKTKKKKEAEGRPVRVWLPRIRLKRVYARGAIAGSPVVEMRVPNARAQILITNKGATIDIQRFRMRASGVGGVDTTANGEIHIRAPGPVWGDVSGTVGQVPLHQKFRFEDGIVDIEGSLPKLRPKSLRPLFGTWPLDRTVSVINHISGRPPILDVKATLAPVNPSEGSKPTTITGRLQLEPQVDAQFDVVTHRLNLNDLFEASPPTRLDSESKVQLKIDGDSPSVEIESKIEEGQVSGQPTPSADLVTKFEDGALSVDGRLEEKGLDARIHVNGHADQPTKFSLKVAKLLLEENERTRVLMPGTRGLVQGKVSGSLDGSRLFTRAELSVGGFNQGNVSFSHGTLEADVNADTESPEEAEGTFQMSLTTAQVGAAKLSSASLTAKGQLLSPHVNLEATTGNGLKLEADAFVGVQEKEIRELKAGISGRGKPVEISASRLSSRGSRITVNELLLKSIGEIRGNIDFGEEGGSIDLEADGLSISRIAHSLGLPRSEYGGDLDADIDLEVGTESNGTVDITVSGGALHGIDNVSLEAHGTIEANKTRGNINGSIAQLGTIESSWEATLAGPLLDPGSTRRATGNLHAHLRNFDLQGFTLLMGKAFGLPPLKGSVDSIIDLKRASVDRFPEGEVQFETKGLVVESGVEGDVSTIRGIDLDGGVFFSPDGDKIEGAVRLNDHDGTLASVSGTIELPLNEWAVEFPQDGKFVDIVRNAPLDSVLVAPRRKLSRWPPYVPIPFENGSIGVRASVTGSLNDPNLGVAIDARKLEGGSSPFSRPVDLEINGQYASTSGTLRSSVALSHDGQRVGSAQTDVLVPVSYLTSPPPGQVPLWKGRVQVQLDNAPLQLLAELQERQVQGTAQGAFSIERTGWTPTISSEVRLRSLAFGGHRLGDALLEAHTHQDDLVARAEFTDEYGNLQVTAEAGVIPTRPLLKVATRRSVLLTLESDRYDAAVMLPFVADLFDELNGSLSGRLKAEWSPPKTDTDEWTTALSGNMKMTDGSITPSALGLRLQEARFNLTAGREGEFNVIHLKSIAARAESERHNLKGDAKFFLKNLDLKGGLFYLSPDEVPLKARGEELATVTGTAQGRFDFKDDVTKVEVSINNLLAELPASADSDLFDLDENPDIEILQYASPQAEDESAEAETPVELRFRLGNNVRVKSNVMDIKLRGSPQMRIAEDLQMAGGIELIPGGRFVVLGRGFNVEQGTVLFDTGDATNPHLSVTASWKAPNDVLVRATVRGTAKEPVLEWSSVPALPGGEPEIIALVLGGGGGSTDQAAAGFSSGIAYAANEAIGTTGVKGVEFYTTQESTSGEGRMASLNDTTWDNYTASFQINDELWFEGSVQNGSGTGPSAQTRRGVSGTLDWRFHPQWSVRTEIGTLGTGLDLVWRYRY